MRSLYKESNENYVKFEAMNNISNQARDTIQRNNLYIINKTPVDKVSAGVLH